MMVEKENDIVVFQYFDNAIDANIAKTKLDAYGIPCFLTEENMAGLYPGQSLYAFKIRLHLFASDRERAESILTGNDLSVQEENSVACPRCHSPRIVRAFPQKDADTIKYLLFGVFFPHRKVNQCLNCGNEF
jgi:hypothetical protein